MTIVFTINKQWMDHENVPKVTTFHLTGMYLADIHRKAKDPDICYNFQLQPPPLITPGTVNYAHGIIDFFDQLKSEFEWEIGNILGELEFGIADNIQEREEEDPDQLLADLLEIIESNCGNELKLKSFLINLINLLHTDYSLVYEFGYQIDENGVISLIPSGSGVEGYIKNLYDISNKDMNIEVTGSLEESYKRPTLTFVTKDILPEVVKI